MMKYCFVNSKNSSLTIIAEKVGLDEYMVSTGGWSFGIQSGVDDRGIKHDLICVGSIDRKGFISEQEIQAMYKTYCQAPPAISIHEDPPWQHHNPISGDYSCDKPEYKFEQEENKMNLRLVTTKIIYTVNDHDVETMSADQLMQCVSDLESNIEELEHIKTESSYIDNLVKEQKETLVIIAKYLDEKGK